MKAKILTFSKCYQAALRTHLAQGCRAHPDTAHGLGSQAHSAGISTLDFAKLHEQILILDLLPGCPVKERAALVEQAGVFFATAITPDETNESIAREAAHLKKIIQTLSERTVELAATNLQLSAEITRRKVVEMALTKSERHYAISLEKSDLLKEQLRGLSRDILTAQEDERKKISRELHDVIAQTLIGINVRLATLKKEIGINTKGVRGNIAATQRLVIKSAEIVHQFARELRPAVLDDLGLIPALHSFMETFMVRNGVKTHLTVFAGVEKLDIDTRTMFFRVVQEALNNVGRHAEAGRVRVEIVKTDRHTRMSISDDGKSFDALAVLSSRGRKRLGLLGMRERVEMMGGTFEIKSAPGEGTTIIVLVPDAGAAKPTRKPAVKNRES